MKILFLAICIFFTANSYAANFDAMPRKLYSLKIDVTEYKPTQLELKKSILRSLVDHDWEIVKQEKNSFSAVTKHPIYLMFSSVME